ncbi:hypothetical protein CCAX7_003120 [Capsulimonas corticalis]|uniref:Uncharacterized protein n=1 Tax=Capsulimonas corticalis TaxID=2219043 RepID=A0A402CS56_9BACT|nr:PAS domain S-box protein [Capsulimonas corticalis]BDI28261.1 hypothetical protein CCAX7_003120 [Capsulimonas corticalis]
MSALEKLTLAAAPSHIRKSHYIVGKKRRSAMDDAARAAALAAAASVAISSCDLDGMITSWNAAAERLYGYSAAEMIGQPQTILLPEGDDPFEGGLAQSVVRNGPIENLEVARRHKSGKLFHASLTLSAIYNTGGVAVGVCAVSRDITQNKRAEEALAESEVRLRRLSDAAFEGIAVSQNGCIADANAAFIALFGYDGLEEVIGKIASDFAASEAKKLISQKHNEGNEQVYEALCQRKDGSTFHAELRGRQILWKGGYARVTAVQDISARKEAEDALRRSEARLTEAQRVAKMGSWEYDVATGGISWSEELFRLFEFDPASREPNYNAFLALIHPDDAAQVVEWTNRAIKHGEGYEIDLRRAPTGRPPQWFHAVGVVVKDDTGKVVRLTGTLTDITERVLSEERFRVLFEYSSDAHLLFDETGVIDCNNAAIAMLRCTNKNELLALHPAVLSPKLQPDGQRSDRKCLEMDRLAWENGYHRFEWIHRKMDGEEFPVEVTLTPVTLRDRPVMLVVWHDLTERKQAEQQIKDYAIVLEFQKKQLESANIALSLLATTDGLTGLKNHRAFQERLTDEMHLAARYDQPTSVVMLDVDHFKQFNDTYGHPEGDEVLRLASRILLENARADDFIARYGGEEFVLLLPQTDGRGAAAIAERIRGAFERAAWSKRQVTVSVGVSTVNAGNAGEGDLVTQADKALYKSKQAGRNCVTMYSG